MNFKVLPYSTTYAKINPRLMIGSYYYYLISSLLFACVCGAKKDD